MHLRRTIVLAAVVASLSAAAIPMPTAAANARLRIMDAEIQFEGTWEEVAQVNEAPGGILQNTKQARVSMIVDVTVVPTTVQLGVFSHATNSWVATTTMNVRKRGSYSWTSGLFATQGTPESLEGYAEYLSSKTWVVDDVTRGGFPLGHVWDRNSVGRWYPNQYSAVIVDSSYGGAYRRATQYFWW